MKDNYRKLGEIVKLVDERNKSLVSTEVLGISIDKEFMPSVANTIGTDLSNYKLLKKNRFACNPMHVGRDERLPVSLYNKEIPAIVSPAYFMFEIVDTKSVLPDYLMLNFKRKDFDRNCWFRTDGSVRGGIAWDDLCELELPVPDLAEQQRIVNAYNTVDRRIRLLQQINEKLEATAQCLFEEALSKKENFYDSTLEEVCNITTGGLNSEDATSNGRYPFFTCSQETYKTDSYAFDQEAVLLAGNNASAIYPLKIFEGKFNAYQRTYVISSRNNFVTNKQIFLSLKQKLSEFREVSLGTTTKFLTMKILNPIPIKIPKENIAKSFNNKLNILFSQIKENEIEITRLLDLRQLIISRISGM